MFLVGQGSHGLYTVAAMTNVNNFAPKYKGTVMGTLAAFFAFSSVLWTYVNPKWTDESSLSNHTFKNTRTHTYIHIHTCSREYHVFVFSCYRIACYMVNVKCPVGFRGGVV